MPRAVRAVAKGGFWKRDRGSRQGLMIPQTVADAFGQLRPEEAEHVLDRAVEILCKQGFVHGGTLIIDATDLVPTEHYQGAGRRTIMEEKRDKDGHVLEVPKSDYGFKLIIVNEVESRIVVAAKLVKLQEHESPCTLELVRKARKNMGKEAKIKILPIDRGFLDGLTLWKLRREMGTDWIVLARSNLEITQAIRGLREIEDKEWTIVNTVQKMIFWSWACEAL